TDNARQEPTEQPQQGNGSRPRCRQPPQPERERPVTTSSVRRTSKATEPAMPVTKGRVIFVGIGPGDPSLLTLGAVAALAEASTIILDREEMADMLAHPAITLTEGSRVVTLGIGDNGRLPAPSARARTVLKHAGDGTRVVRLVAGDPFLDNGVADEAAACVRGGIDFEVVPGVSSLTAVPEYAGVALHHAGGTHFISAMDGRFPKVHTAQWATVGTVVISTVAGALGDLVKAALAAGRPEADHAMVTRRGGSIEQYTWSTTLAGLADGPAPELPDDEPVHVMLGIAEEKREDLSWFESKPLFGWR